MMGSVVPKVKLSEKREMKLWKKIRTFRVFMLSLCTGFKGLIINGQQTL